MYELYLGQFNSFKHNYVFIWYIADPVPKGQGIGPVIGNIYQYTVHSLSFDYDIVIVNKFINYDALLTEIGC